MTQRYVKTQEGAKRFGVGVGQPITGHKGDGTTAAKTAKAAPTGPPTKFVGTVPGQKAKLPVMTAQSSSGGGSGLSHTDNSAMGNVAQMSALVGVLTQAQLQAMRAARAGNQLNPAQRQTMIALLQQAIAKYNRQQSVSSSSAAKTAAKKMAAAAAKTSAAAAAKKSAKSGTSAPAKLTTAQWVAELKIALHALRGNKSGGSSHKAPPPAHHVNTSKIPSSFSGMPNDKLLKSIRSLVAMKRAALHDPAALARVNHALEKAKAERARRGL